MFSARRKTPGNTANRFIYIQRLVYGARFFVFHIKDLSVPPAAFSGTVNSAQSSPPTLPFAKLLLSMAIDTRFLLLSKSAKIADMSAALSVPLVIPEIVYVYTPALRAVPSVISVPSAAVIFAAPSERPVLKVFFTSRPHASLMFDTETTLFCGIVR